MPARRPTRASIKNDLIDQLERNGTTGNYYIDLVSDYMDMYDTKRKLLADIKARGVVVDYVNANGTTSRKKNESVELQIKINAQMIRLLDALGITPLGGEPASDEIM